PIDVCGLAASNITKKSPKKKTAAPIEMDTFKKADSAVHLLFISEMPWSFLEASIVPELQMSCTPLLYRVLCPLLDVPRVCFALKTNSTRMKEIADFQMRPSRFGYGQRREKRSKKEGPGH